MANYFQCPHCGAPNDADDRCSYCGNIFSGETKLALSNSDKGTFDLAIYELSNGNFEKSLSFFEEIIKNDSNNQLAWLYKYICEFSKSKNLPEFIKNIRSISNVLYNLFSDLIFNTINKYLKYTKIGSNRLGVLFDYVITLDNNFKSKIQQIFHDRYFRLNWRDAGYTIEIINEIDVALRHKEIFNLDLAKTQELLYHLSELNLRDLKFYNIKIFDSKTHEAIKRIYVREFSQGLNQRLINIIEKYQLDPCPEKLKISILNSQALCEDLQKRCKLYTQSENEVKNETSCFIATASMGSHDHPVVMDLRMFRDNWLLKRKWGIAFTDWYYRYGPKAAAIIEKSDMLKRISYVFFIKPLHLIAQKLVK